MLFAPTKEYFGLMHECEMPAFTPPAERQGQDFASDKPISVSLFPNPSNGRVTIQFQNGSPDANCRLKLLGADGKEMFESRIQRPKQEFDLKLAPGLYLYEIRCDDGLVDKGKLIITSK